MGHLNPVRAPAIAGFCALFLLASGAALGQGASGGGTPPAAERAARVVEHWTAERRASAIPRDLFISHEGRAYQRGVGGTLIPYGSGITGTGGTPAPFAKPDGNGGGRSGKGGGDGGGSGGSGDSTPPAISSMDPVEGAVIGASETFSAVVTDVSGVKSVSFVIEYPDGSTTRSFSASAGANDTWSVIFEGFSPGSWRWWVIAKDYAAKGGNTGMSDPVAFTVDVSGGVVSNSQWTFDGDIQNAGGRIYFEMPATGTWSTWNAYVCSGTVVTDETSGRSVILTAAHCVYDDTNKAFARNVLFIPDQDGTTATGGTDTDCGNDPLGCWVPAFGVVDTQWASRTFPENIRWDVAFYVVPDSGAHAGTGVADERLDAMAGSLPVSFAPPAYDMADDSDYTHALGYSYSDDPYFMYCAEDMTTEGVDNWWLPNCGLSGGASGGSWVQPMDRQNGSGPVISINSWGYVNVFGQPLPGMAGPFLDTGFAECVFMGAKTGSAASTQDGLEGIETLCPF